VTAAVWSLTPSLKRRFCDVRTAGALGPNDVTLPVQGFGVGAEHLPAVDTEIIRVDTPTADGTAYGIERNVAERRRQPMQMGR